MENGFIEHQQLDENEVHLWIIDPSLFSDLAQLGTFKNLLDQQEQDKIDRYRLDSAKQTALITRAFIRIILSEYEAVSPQDWQFIRSDLGKPEIANSNIGLRFNLSHNNNLIICAICLNHDIGCDIESLSRKMSILPIADRFFSDEESQLIKALPEHLQRKGFFECWTLKESFVKATGKGISQGLDTFRFEFKVNNGLQYREDINLFTDNKNKSEIDEHWFNALVYPDNKHVIAISVNTNKNMKIQVNENARFVMNSFLDLARDC